MALPISLQLYTVRDLIKQDGYQSVLKAVRKIGYGQVEMGDLYGQTPKAMRKILDDIGLQCSGWWAPFLNSEKRSEVLDTAAALGIRDIMGGYGPKDFESDDKVRALAGPLNEALGFYQSKGLTISLHNHNWEFTVPGRYDLLLEQAPKANLEVDVYWVQVGGGDPAAFIKQHGKRVRFLHMKDGPANAHDPAANMTAVGQGDVASADCVRAAEYGGNCRALVVELDRCATDMLQAVRDSYDFLTRKNLAQGQK